MRPRRFGKSLFLSNLETYYDINTADSFDELFGDLYIGKNPTLLKNKYPILKLNFSEVVTQESIDEIERAFNARICSQMNLYFEKYKETLSIENIVKSHIQLLEKAPAMTLGCNKPYMLFVSLIT